MAVNFLSGTSPTFIDTRWVLLVKILNASNAGGGGGGGGGTTQVYTGAAPPAAPTDPTKPALFYPTGGGTLLQWDGAAWV